MTAILSLFDAHKRLLDTATKDDEAPTPGYMYNEINKITFESYDQSIKVLEHLLLRLKKNNSAAVKLKVLIVMKSIIQKGNPQFRRELQRKSEEIRECLYFKGPPDPLRGDTPYKVVRDQAQVVLNMLFDTETNETISTASMGSTAGPSDLTASKLPSISSNNFPTTTTTPSNGAHFGGMYRGPTSMGNVMYEKKEPTMLEKMKAGIVKITTRKQPAPEHTAPISTYGKIANLAEPNFREYTGPIEPNKPLGGWHDPNEARVQANVNSPLPRTLFSTQTTVPEHAEEPQTSTGDKERRLVEELTQPTGVRAVPSTAELNQFVRSCQQGALDLFALYDALTDKLASNRWQARLKALHAIEVLLKNDVDNAVPYFAEHVSALQEQLTSLQKSVADKTQQILALIQPSVAHPQDESAFNFINDDGASGSSSIFDGLNTEDSSSTLFSGLSLSESAAQPEGRSQGDLIDFTETPGPRAVVSAPTSPAPPRTVDLDLLNIDFNARPASAPAPLVQTVPVQYVQYGQTLVPLISPSMPVYAPLSVTAVPANQLPATHVAPSPFAAAPYEQPQLPVLNANLYSGPSVYNTQAAKKKSSQNEGFGFVHSAAEDDFDFVTTEIQAMKAKTPTK